jgi:hypothetical protein
MSARYDLSRQLFGEGSLSWTRDAIVAQLVTADYKFNLAHRDRRDLRGLIGEPVALTGRTVPRGFAKADSVLFREVKSGDVVGVVFRRDAADESKTNLIFYADGIAGFPMRANGGDIKIDLPAQGIFRL